MKNLTVFVPNNQEEVDRMNKIMTRWRKSRGLPPWPPVTLESYLKEGFK